MPAIELELANGFHPVVIERWLRVWGDSLRRIAETERPIGGGPRWSAPLLASGMAEVEMLGVHGRASRPGWLPSTEQTLLAVYRGQQEHDWSERPVEPVEVALENAGLTAGWTVRRRCASSTSRGTRE